MTSDRMVAFGTPDPIRPPAGLPIEPPIDPHITDGLVRALALVQRNGRLVSRNIVVRQRRTSVRLEPTMWEGLRDIAAGEGISVNQVVTAIAACRPDGGSLTSAIRIFVMEYYRARQVR